jgi:AcrR family transcriptional regulator
VAPSTPGRKPYDSPIRREQMARTRERILEAACDLVHEYQTWDWRALTYRAVADRAGVGERTVYRHFATEQALHEAVMRRLGESVGVSYEGMDLADVSKLGAKVFQSMSDFAAPAWTEPEGTVFAVEDERRKQALLAAVEATTAGWSEEERVRAAAALDAMWSIPSYLRLVSGWNLDADQATEVMDWVIGVVVAAIEQGDRP